MPTQTDARDTPMHDATSTGIQECSVTSAVPWRRSLLHRDIDACRACRAFPAPSACEHNCGIFLTPRSLSGHYAGMRTMAELLMRKRRRSERQARLVSGTEHCVSTRSSTNEYHASHVTGARQWETRGQGKYPSSCGDIGRGTK